ncbi:MAG: DUF882 domain-containing protein [Steroidobacteraceae bacterium]|jgi:uncharacterized protein YcbK (DUF882 family)
MSWSRRRLLGAAGMIAGASAAGMLGAAAEAADTPATRRIVLKSLHTPESLDIVFRRGDDYVPDALSAIQVLLRDYRTGAQHPIDPRLLDYLHDVAQLARVEPVFAVVSGYRSPQTNEMLHERSNGVASRSLHMEGRAIDVRLARVDCTELAEKALAVQRGGVGYYHKSDFVHLDTGRFRTWRG